MMKPFLQTVLVTLLTFYCAQAQQGNGFSKPTTLRTAPDQYLVFDDVRLRYRDFGQGEPIVLLHGYADNLRSAWAGIGNWLAETHRIIVLDERGFGKSSAFSDPARYRTEMITDVIRLLDSLGIQQAHLIGHSMGALIAANVALRYPDRVAGLILVAGTFYPDSAAFMTDFKPISSDLQNGRGLSGLLSILFPMVNDSATLIALNQEIMSRNHVGALLAVGHATPSWLISSAQAARATVPALFLAGANDPLLPVSRQVAGVWPNARLVEIAGANQGTILRSSALLNEVRIALQARTVSSR